MKRKKLKLFVWTNFCPDWTGGLAVALAENLEQAQEMIAGKQPHIYTWGDLTVYELDQPMSESVSGGS